MSPSLWRASLRYLARHRMQALLSVLGVALGIAVVFSIDLVNESSRTAFRLATDAVTGKATHHIVGGPKGLPQETYTRLRVGLGFRKSAPIVEGYISIEGLPGRAVQLFGVDLFAEAPFRANFGEQQPLGVDLNDLLLTSGVYVPDVICEEIDVTKGDDIVLDLGNRQSRATVLGSINTGLENTRGFDNLIVADIATAQDILGMDGVLSRIDLIIDDEADLGRIAAILPPGGDIVRSQSRSQQVEKMTASFSRNLFALSLLALVVGMFLIYNTMTFSVVQRRTLIGDLRTLGVTRREVFALVLSEAAVIGAVGTFVGLLLGVGLANVLLGMVTRTINDLYFVLSVRELDMTPFTVGKAVLLGMGATLASASLPAREATRTAPRSVQHRSSIESGTRAFIPKLTLAGLVLVVVGGIMLMMPSRYILLGYLGLPPLVTGFALLTPGVVVFAITRVPAAMRNAMGVVGRIAVRSILSQLSRSSVAIAALAIAVGTTVGVTTMVGSFRQSVVDWLEVTLDADLYITPPASGRNDVTLSQEFVRDVQHLPGVSGVNVIRGLSVQTQHGIANFAALRQISASEKRFEFLAGDSGAAWRSVNAGAAVLVSEPYAYRYEVSVGDSVSMLTESGRHSFVIAGVYRDYASDIGTVLMDLETYRQYWQDESVSGVGLFLDNAQTIEETRRRVNELAAKTGAVVVRSNHDLREISMEVFDRTFAITNVLRLLTIVVAFVGVLSALMALQLERARELGVLRALGLTPGQLWRLVTTQTGIMGLFAGIIALPFGLMLAMVLTLVINKRSFGWTLDLHLSADVFVQAVMLAVIAALIAGLYPGYRMSRTSPARALREE